MKRTERYERDLRKTFKWDNIKTAAQADGEVWLGSIFGLTPSGKMYAPFACSNVIGCKRCGGKGEVVNHKADAAKYEEADNHNAGLVAELLANYGPWYEQRWPEAMKAELEASRKVAVDNMPVRRCSWCNGHGSHEAAKDSDWWSALESVANEHGLLLGRLEGEEEDGVWVCSPLAHDAHIM
jgi:hypothetical protein